MRIKQIFSFIIILLCSFAVSFSASAATEHFTNPSTSTEFPEAWFGRVTIEGTTAVDNADEVGVFIQIGSCQKLIGSAKIGETIAGAYFINVTKDNGSTAEKEGAVVGDQLIFKVWDKDADKEYIVPQGNMAAVSTGNAAVHLPAIPPLFQEGNNRQVGYLDLSPVAADLSSYTVTFNVANAAQGEITGTTPQTVNHTTTAVTATAKAGYAFDKWTEANGCFSDSTDNPITVTVSSDLTLTANFITSQKAMTFVNSATANNQTGNVGTVLPVAIQLKVTDGSGTAVSGVTPTAKAGSDGTITFPATDASGETSASWTLGSTVGAQTLTIELATYNDVTVNATATDGRSITIQSGGSGQTAAIGAALANPVVVDVTDETGQPVDGKTIDGTGDGSIAVAAEGTTGRYNVTWTLGTTAGPQSMVLTVQGYPATILATATATATDGRAISIESGGSGQSAVVGTALSNPVVVKVLDEAGQPLDGQTIIKVSGDGSIVPTGQGGSTGLYDVVWTLGTTVGSQSIVLGVQGYPGTITVTATATATVAPPCDVVAAFTSDATVQVGTAINFTNASTGTGAATATWEWDYTSDGTIDATSQHASTTYTTVGDKVAKLIATLQDGSCFTVATKTITVTCDATAAFTADTSTGFDVTFDTTGSAGTLSWDYGDTTTGTTASHTYTSGGNYTVTLTAEGTGGCTDVATQNITVSCDATAAFTADTSTGYEVTFDTTGATGTLSWDYGDGSPAGTTASHTYTAAGPYTVVQTATGTNCTDTETKQINVTCNAVASFTADTSNGFTVSFDATASTGTLAWDFGDTATEGDVTQPSHTYASAGFYTVELTATGGGACTTTATQVIEIKCDATAKFTASPQILDLNGAASVSASFTNLSTGAAVDGSTATWSWDTDGDTTEDSTLKTPPDQDFSTVGKYNASLTATGTSCSTDYIVPILVNDSSACSVTAGFTVAGNKTTIEINESLDFTNTSQNADTYAWDFDNDGTDDSTNAGFDPTPESHSYGAVGEYYAVLTATDSTATPAACSAYASKMITVICDVRAAFTSPASAEVGSPVTFTNTSEGTGVAAAGTTWEWDLDGDGTIDSTAKSPQKTYTAEGTYDVKLIATSAAGCITSETATITITVPVVEVTANFTYSPAEPKANAPVAFTDQSTTTAGLTITGWAWDFGDGSTSTDKNPTHTFTEEKTYAVKLVVTADNGRKASTERSIAVLAPEVDADFSSAPSTGNEPLEVTFTDKSTGLNLNSWSWTFGDGGTSTDQNPVHKYTDTGIFNVVLTIANSTGASDIVQKTVVVLVNDIIQIEAKFEAATDELKAVFTDKSTISKGEIKSWNWDFGGEGTSTEQNPTFTFPADGTYAVKLTVADQDGNTADVTENVTVEEDVVITAAFGVATSDLEATFTDMSTINKGNITSWSWMFGNDGTSTEQNPVHTFSADGTYAVKLTVADGNGNQDDVTKDVTVEAAVNPPVLKADFTADKTEGDIPLTVTFTDASTAENDTITNWAWNFGDGSTAEDTEGKPQTHTYNTAGTFYAELTITGASGGGDTKVMEIKANDPGSVCPDCPEAPTPVAPADGSTISIMAPELQVESSTEAKSTKWQISDNTNFSVLLWAETNDKFTFQVPELLLAPNTTYYWRARFINEANKESVWSTVFHFTTPETDPDDQSGSGVPDDQDVDDPETIFPDVPDNEKTIFIKSAKGDITFAVEGIEEVLAILSGKAYSGDDVTPPENVTFDWGFVQFKAQLNGNGKTAKFKLHFSEKLPDGKTVKWYLKVGDELTDFSDYVTVSEDGKSAIIEITDGDFGDLDGLENGYILHMIGMGFTTVPSGGDGGGGGNTCFIQSLAGGVSSSIVIWLSLLSGVAALVWGRKRQ